MTYRRAGAGVLSTVLGDGSATYTPGISERRGSTTTYAHTGLKSAEAQSQSGQTITASRQYDAFGNVSSSTGTFQGYFGYAGPFGYQEDSDHSLRLLGHRYYDSDTGRFLTRDPIKDGRNWYAYGGGNNNPLNGVDVDGRKFFEFVGKVGGAVVAGAVAGSVGGPAGLLAGTVVGLVIGTVGATVGAMADSAIAGNSAAQVLNDGYKSGQNAILYDWIPMPKLLPKDTDNLIGITISEALKELFQGWIKKPTTYQIREAH